jgi:nitroimidazol reductase NimA-like FMN-containing flavoprotein (pyridoxamine 5'-phosphate oxidase superfamily)
VNFGFEYENGQLKLYVHSAKEGRKAEAFDKEPPVAIEMDCAGPLITGEYTCNYSMAYRSIMGNGIIRKVKNNDEKTKALTLLMNKLDAQAEIHFLDKQLEAVNVYCIEVSSFTGKKREPK